MTDLDAVRQTRHALAQIREAWPYLDDAKDASLRKGRPEPRPMGTEARLTLDDLIRAERGDRLAQQRAGRYPLPPAPAPVALDVVDAEQLVRATLVELSWLAASALRTRGFGWPPLQVTPANATDFLAAAVPHLADQLARDTADLLTDAALALRAALGLDIREDETVIDGRLWITAKRAEHYLPDAKPHNVHDWYRRGLVIDANGNNRSVISDRRRWYPLADLRRARDQVKRQAA